jgi:hypothetical protein
MDGRYLEIGSLAWRDMTLEGCSKTTLQILIDCLTDSLGRRPSQSKQIRMFKCHSLIDELVPDEKIPRQVYRWFNRIPIEPGESRETGSEVKGDRVFVAHRASEKVCKRPMDRMCEIGENTKVRLELKRRSLTLDRWRK